MNWKLIFLLSLLGPLLALAGIYSVIGFNIEPYVMFTVFFSFAIIIGRIAKRQYFVHGMLTVLLTGLLMSIVRLKLLNVYVQRNPEVIDQVENLLHKFYFIRSPFLILSMLILISGIITGLLSITFSKLFKKPDLLSQEGQ